VNYAVRLAAAAPPLQPDWTDPIWQQAETLKVEHFRPEGSDHHPDTSARLLYDAKGIYGIFQVRDRYVRCVRTQYHDPVWKDSCVEFFAQPRPDRGYFNFEFNFGGAFLCSYITNPERMPEGFKEFIKVPASIGQTIRVKSSLPQRVEPEITTPVVWALTRLPLFGLVWGRKSLEIKPRAEKVCTTTPQLSLAEAVIRGGGCSGRVSFN
jgi:hypothetical protein